MKSSITSTMWKLGQPGFKLMMLAAALGLPAMGSANVAVANDCFKPGILPMYAMPYGRTYPEWTTKWWQWAISLPFVPGHGHPCMDDPAFQVTAGQCGNVWFLGAPIGAPIEEPVVRTCEIPYGKALFIAVINIEASDLEAEPFYGETEDDQRAVAKYFADHIVKPYCVIDGKPVKNMYAYRVPSPQFGFTAPNLNMLGVPDGGSGKSVSDGYWIMLAPLSEGKHIIQFGGEFRLPSEEGGTIPVNIKYNLTVRKPHR